MSIPGRAGVEGGSGPPLRHGPDRLDSGVLATALGTAHDASFRMLVVGRTLAPDAQNSDVSQNVKSFHWSRISAL